MKYLYLCLSVLLMATTVTAQEKEWTEREWSKYLALEVIPAQHEGSTAIYEARLPDLSRIDIYEYAQTEKICWEVEWCDKWEESIGQSLFYYHSLRNSPGKPHAMGIWLLKTSNDDEDYLRCLMVVNELKSKGFPIYLRVQKVSK